MEQTGTDLRIAAMPGMQWDSYAGRHLLTTLAAAAELQADIDSSRMKDQMHGIFEAGGHRGKDPFGYATARTGDGLVEHPRRLVIVEHEAVVVRRAFDLLAEHTLSGVASILNAEGARHRWDDRQWGQSAIRDLWRRREVYRGNVTLKRGLDPRKGTHEPIISEAVFNAAVQAVYRRKRQIGQPRRGDKRAYLLRGRVFCECGTKMRGDAKSSRGRTWRYYVCPAADRRIALLDDSGVATFCTFRRVKADDLEDHVLAFLLTQRTDQRLIDAARAQVQTILSGGPRAEVDQTRGRLLATKKRFTRAYAWGDMTEPDYREELANIEAQLAALVPDDRMADFERAEAIVSDFAAFVAGTRELETGAARLQAAVALLVERVDLGGPEPEVTLMPRFQTFYYGGGAVVQVPLEGAGADHTTAGRLDYYTG